MIDIKYCEKCKKTYESEVCPYCQKEEEELKEIKKRIRDGWKCNLSKGKKEVN